MRFAEMFQAVEYLRKMSRNRKETNKKFFSEAEIMAGDTIKKTTKWVHDRKGYVDGHVEKILKDLDTVLHDAKKAREDLISYCSHMKFIRKID